MCPGRDDRIVLQGADVAAPLRAYIQSGVLFLGYNFGLPVIASDVASLREEIIEGKTGFVFKPRDSADLASKIDKYFDSRIIPRP